MTTRSNSTDEPVYTNGRLVIDEDMAFDILEMIENRRVLTLIIRADLRASGYDEASAHLTTRLKRLQYLSKRVNALIMEKGWGDTGDEMSTILDRNVDNEDDVTG